MSDLLFDVPEQLSPRLKTMREHDVQVHHAPLCTEVPYMASPMHAARQVAENYTDDECDTIADITASVGRVLDEQGLIFTGMTQKEVEDDALAWIAQNQPKRDDT